MSNIQNLVKIEPKKNQETQDETFEDDDIPLNGISQVDNKYVKMYQEKESEIQTITLELGTLKRMHEAQTKIKAAESAKHLEKKDAEYNIIKTRLDKSISLLKDIKGKYDILRVDNDVKDRKIKELELKSQEAVNEIMSLISQQQLDQTRIKNLKVLDKEYIENYTNIQNENKAKDDFIKSQNIIIQDLKNKAEQILEENIQLKSRDDVEMIKDFSTQADYIKKSIRKTSKIFDARIKSKDENIKVLSDQLEMYLTKDAENIEILDNHKSEKDEILRKITKIELFNKNLNSELEIVREECKGKNLDRN